MLLCLSQMHNTKECNGCWEKVLWTSHGTLHFPSNGTMNTTVVIEDSLLRVMGHQNG